LPPKKNLSFGSAQDNPEFIEGLKLSPRFARRKPPKSPEKNIGANHILILGEENFL